jgi:carbonic anhydrase
VKLEKFFVLVVALFVILGCASHPGDTLEVAPAPAPAPPPTTHQPVAATPTSDPAPAPTKIADMTIANNEMSITLKKNQEAAVKATSEMNSTIADGSQAGNAEPTLVGTEAATVAIPKATSAKIKTLRGVEPEKAYGWLKNGNTRFLKGKLRKDGQAKADIRNLSKGQSPHTVILSCSDSRVPPEIIFDQKLGEIFVIRTAGEALDATVIGSIEYAVEHLGTRLILTLGHTSCGAVKAAIATLGGNTGFDGPNIEQIVKDIQPRIAKVTSTRASSDNDKAESWENARGAAKDLVERSQILSDYVKSGQLKIKTALYNTENGKVEFE